MPPKISYKKLNVVWASMPGTRFVVAEVYLDDQELFGVVYFDEIHDRVFLECWGNGQRTESVGVDLRELQALLSKLENEILEMVRTHRNAEMNGDSVIAE